MEDGDDGGPIGERGRGAEKMVVFWCYLQYLSKIYEKVHGIRSDFEKLSDFVSILTRANSKYTLVGK